MKLRAFSRFLDRSLGRKFGKIIATCYQGKSEEDLAPRRIVFIKLWAIGESILTLPSLRALRDNFPNATITVVTTEYASDVFRGQQFINRVDAVSANPFSYVRYLLQHIQDFDISIDGEPYLFASAWGARIVGKRSIGFATCGREFLYDKKTQYNDMQHVTATYGDLVREVGVNTPISQSLVPLKYTQKDLRIVEDALKKQGISENKPVIVLCPTVGGSVKGRMWPVDRFIALADELTKTNQFQIVFLGSGQDASLLNSLVNQTRKQTWSISTFTLPQTAYFLKKASLVIANDSGLMHLAAAMNTPTLGLFGPNTPVRFAPLNAKSRYIYHPCTKPPHINVHTGEIPEIDCECMQNISVSEVLQVAAEMLTGYDRRL